jgi:hypothetical protein
MMANPASLLVRITDLLYTPVHTLGSALGTAPSHHIVMENVLYGKESSPSKEQKKKWETYDLKPSDYFFPERDIAGGKLAPESVKERLIDHFPDKVRVTHEEKQDILDVLDKDTKVLEKAGVVDYSLFLVRYPQDIAKEVPAALAGNSTEWRSGLKSRDGKWVYRAVLLDFFWAKSELVPKAMTGLVSSFNFFARKGPMSITTTPREYRERFLGMVENMVVAEEEDQQSSSTQD